VNKVQSKKCKKKLAGIKQSMSEHHIPQKHTRDRPRIIQTITQLPVHVQSSPSIATFRQWLFWTSSSNVK